MAAASGAVHSSRAALAGQPVVTLCPTRPQRQQRRAVECNLTAIKLPATHLQASQQALAQLKAAKINREPPLQPLHSLCAALVREAREVAASAVATRLTPPRPAPDDKRSASCTSRPSLQAMPARSGPLSSPLGCRCTPAPWTSERS